MSPQGAWAGLGGDLLVVAGLAGGLLAWLAEAKPALWSYVTTAWAMACVGALAWAIADPSTLATACATALLLGLVLAWYCELRPLALPLTALALALGFVNHLPAWWPSAPTDLTPVAAYWTGVGHQALGLSLGAWALSLLCQGARALQGPRALPQAGVGSDLLDAGRLSAWLWGVSALAAFAAFALALAQLQLTWAKGLALLLVLALGLGGLLAAAQASAQASSRLKPRQVGHALVPAASALAWLGLWVLSYFPQL